MKKQSSYGRILLVRISMLAMTVIAALWWQEKAESMGIVYASETEDVQISDKTQNMELLESMDFTDIDRMMEDLFPQERMEFADAVRQIMMGNTDVGRDAIKEMLRERIFGAWEVNRKSILYLILLAIASAVFIGFSDIFQTRQVSQISFYMIYLLVMGICLASFQAASEWMANGVHTLTGFMKVLYPVYFAAVTVAKGSISSLAFYHLAIILIVVIEELLLHLIVPGIHMYVIIRVMNSLQSEDYLSKFAELLGEVVWPDTKKNLQARVDAEHGATQGKKDLATLAKQLGYDAIHDTVHEMCKDEARHGCAFQGLLE